MVAVKLKVKNLLLREAVTQGRSEKKILEVLQNSAPSQSRPFVKRKGIQ